MFNFVKHYFASRENRVPYLDSLLKKSIIPDVLKVNVEGKFNQFIKILNSKLVYIHLVNEHVSMPQNISKSIGIGPNGTQTKQDFAIMDTTNVLNMHVESLRRGACEVDNNRSWCPLDMW